MQQRVWILLVVVVAVLLFGFLYWPSGTGDTAIDPTGAPATTAPEEAPATE